MKNILQLKELFSVEVTIGLLQPAEQQEEKAITKEYWVLGSPWRGGIQRNETNPKRNYVLKTAVERNRNTPLILFYMNYFSTEKEYGIICIPMVPLEWY